jgi:uncharacterized protein involved in exopolysaccharide biosynthesis
MTAPRVVTDDGISPLELLVIAVRHRWRVIVLGIVGAAAFATYALLQPRTYTVTWSFQPQSSRNTRSMSGLAAQLGFSVPGSDGSESPDFYVELLSSRQLLGGIADTTVMTSGGTPRRVFDLLDVDDGPPAIRRDEAIGELDKRIAPGANAKTNVVKVTVRAPDPRVGLEISRLLMQGLIQFNVRTRQTQAAAERKFLEGRLSEVERNFRRAEDRLQEFAKRNRAYREGSELSFERDRLVRDVNRQSEIYTALAQSFEQAKIDEVRNTPLIGMIEAPEMPARPDGRGVVRKTLVGFVAGMIAAFLWIVLIESGAMRELRKATPVR